MTSYICTICCKDKKTDQRLLDASERYISDRIQFVLNESNRLNKPLLILSGKYGILMAYDKIPWYDKQLTFNDLEDIVPLIIQQLKDKKAAEIFFYGRSRDAHGWEPYYQAIEKSCAQLGIPIYYREVSAVK